MLSSAALLLIVGLHPIHSSSASLTLARGASTARLAIRVFTEDFPPGRNPAAIAQYLEARFGLFDRTGRRLALRLDSLRADGPVLVLALSAPAPAGLAGARVWHGVLGERFRDQVNLLQAHYAGRTVSLLFTTRDGPKPLP